MPAGRPKREDGRNAQTVALQKFQKENYDRLSVSIEKTEKEKLMIAAELAGQSLAQYVSEACNRRIEQDSVENPELIAAMQRYYAETLLPARAAREERTRDKIAPERMNRPEMHVVYDAEGKPLQIVWSTKKAPED